jgi:hypothetical protein
LHGGTLDDAHLAVTSESFHPDEEHHTKDDEEQYHAKKDHIDQADSFPLSFVC